MVPDHELKQAGLPIKLNQLLDRIAELRVLLDR